MKYLALTLSLLFSSAVTADSSYSGVWQVSADNINGFISIHANSEWMITADLDTDEGDWSAMEGPITGNKATLNTIFTNSSRISYEVTFTSPTEGFIVLKSCEPMPGYVCSLPNGAGVPIVKIF